MRPRSPSWSARGTPVARMNTGIDGGMNQVFAAKLPDGNTGLSEERRRPGPVACMSRAPPGTIPATTSIRRTGRSTSPDEPLVASSASRLPCHASWPPPRRCARPTASLATWPARWVLAARRRRQRQRAAAAPQAGEAEVNEPSTTSRSSRKHRPNRRLRSRNQTGRRPPAAETVTASTRRLPRRTMPSPVRSRSYRPIRSRTASRRPNNATAYRPIRSTARRLSAATRPRHPKLRTKSQSRGLFNRNRVWF